MDVGGSHFHTLRKYLQKTITKQNEKWKTATFQQFPSLPASSYSVVLLLGVTNQFQAPTIQSPVEKEALLIVVDL